MYELKPISKESIPAALDKARLYRLLNQPWHAESICRDILKTDPENQSVIYTLVLAITDLFEDRYKKRLSDALSEVEKLTDPYQQEYCKGLVYERKATAAYKRQSPRASYIAYEYLTQALEHYNKANELRHESNENEEAILRWNACVRFINRYNLKPSPEEPARPTFLDV